MRILFCNYEYPPLGGGGGIVNALLAEELAKQHEVTVLTSQGLGLPGEREENSVRVIRVPVLFRRKQATANIPSMLAYLPMGILAGKKLLKNTHYDVINTHFVLPTGPVGRALSRFAKIPQVLSVHGGDLYDPSKWLSPHRHGILRVWVRTLLQNADRIVGQSRNTLDNVRKFYDPTIQADRIPLGIRRPLDGTASRHDYGFGQNEVLLITVGRLVARKAIDQLISLMKNLNSAYVHLLIMGAGPQEQVLREQAGALQLKERIHFLGHRGEAEKFKLLRMCDIYVSTSQHEGFGLVFLEAMASGLPVICYDHGGQTDFLENDHTGYLVQLNDEASLIQYCQRLILNADLRQQMGQENLKRVEDFYIDHCAACYENLFSEVIEGYRRKQAHGYPYWS
jgi:glycosyltransferase involved in cell wall biosynthesis